MKKLICAAAAALLMSAVFPAAPAAADNDPDFTYYSYSLSSGEIIIGHYSGSDTTVVIPSEIKGYPVVEINRAFSKQNNIVECVIPDSVRTIDEKALSNCPNLRSVTIGSGVTKIGDYAFTACPELSEIKVSEDNPTYTAINGSLYDKNGTLLHYAGSGKAEIAASTKAVGKAAFFGRTDLYSVDIPESVTAIGDYAFSGCLSLSGVKLPDAVSSIGKGCFMSCTSLESAELGKAVKSIPEDCFYSCTALSDITIPEGVTSIGDKAFYGCAELSGLLVPSTVTSLGTDCIGRRYNIRSEASENIPGFIIRGETATATQKYAQICGIAYSGTNLEMGDVNGDRLIDAVDASVILAEYAVISVGGKRTFTEDQFIAADWNKDGFTDAVDASAILAEYARLQTPA